MAIKSSYLFASTFSLLLSLNFLTIPSQSAYAQAATKGVSKGQKIRYIPPKDLGILSKSIPGIFRGDECIQDIDVTCVSALIPDAKPTLNTSPLTISARPTFFFSVPKIRSRATFILDEVDATGKNTRIYKSTFPVESTSGVIGFTMPADAPALKVNKIYAWKFILKDINTDKDVLGTVHRIELSPSLSKQLENVPPLERAALYAKLGIWYDSVKILAEIQQADPNRKQPLPEWVDLLKSVNLERLAMRPLVKMRL
ncbi:hypothetical protein TUMEXPCC7403_02205 [Tumidithrix helvetica PCC 7403]|uniref:DUF928 domain-containing protein n=1 Tax=Tumidithrix helvetica TaxID=3457545 RepID=UPI003C88B1D7